jgi:phage/plasmid-associated DNA primase
MVVFPEVEGTVKNGILKVMTGGDMITARLLNKNPETFYLNGSILLYFNKAPELDTKCGQSEARRIVDVDFPYNFTEKPEELALGKPYIKGNSEYIQQEWNIAHRLEMLHILLDVYKEHKKPNGMIDLKFPQSILKRTATFIENQNPFVKIIAQNYTVTAMEKPTDFKKLKGIGFAKIWGEVKMTEEYKNMTTRQRKEYSRDELYDYLRKNKQFITNTTAQDVSSIYNLTRINLYEEEDPEAEYKKP